MMDDGAEKVVVSGMSGLYPESHSVKELSHILYNKINPVNAKRSRWQYEHPEVALYTGKVPDLMLYDAQFFKVHFRLGIAMDPMTRKMQEQAYQAIYDAGFSPTELYGKNVGVFVGTCFSETEKTNSFEASYKTGFGLMGCCKAMFANRISYWLNAKGPSVALDVACCSSVAALEQAHLAMTRGDCDAAIVGGSSLCLHPQTFIHNGRIMEMSMNGKTRSFDSNASGCARSEAINVLFLQKAKDARRVYAEILHIKCKFNSLLETESGPKLGFYRNPSNVAAFMKDFYDEAKVSPNDVEYVEAFGAAAAEVDKSELEAISEVFCKKRSDPLLVGSVMSNIGYAGAATGIAAVTKVLLGYHTGQLAANLHYETPRSDIPAVREGKLRILDEHQKFDRTYAAVNSYSITGVNAHVLLHGRYKPKDLSRYKANIPQLVTISSRQESYVKSIIDNLQSRPIDPEELALLRNIHKTNIFGHFGRGFVILDTNENNETVCLCEKSAYLDDAKRPLCFMYSGMGSQWPGMGAQLMRIPIFAAAIERCQRALQPKGVDVINIITSTEKTIFDNILHSFVGIAAIQIGLTDVLTELGIVPDIIIGHSVGELGCAYADGCFTAEEMILSAYSRGLVSLQTPFIKGSMAAVGVGYEQISKMCPPEIEVACHNGPDTSTISGPADKMRDFVAQLTSKGIFAREVPSSNIAYHSSYIAEAGPGLLKCLREVIKTPKPRSERWLSTSIPQDKWNEPIAKYSSAEYHTNNLLNSVLFEETSRLIPANAVVVEIAPHGLLQAIVKRSLPSSCRHVPLTRRGHIDNALFLLEAIGKLYLEGYSSKIETLYPKIDYPVSTGTPMLSHFVEWAHSEKWPLPLYMATHRKTAAACQYIISTHDDENVYLKDHIIKEKNLYPLSTALVLVWDTLAMVLGVEKKQFSIQFNDIHIHSQPMLHNQRTLRLNIALHRGAGRFEVLSGSIKILTGYAIGETKDYKFDNDLNLNKMLINTKDIYKLLNARDYNYSGKFRSIHSTDLSLSEANIVWEDNWVTALDGMIQLNVLRRTHETISQPEYIRKIVIDVNKHIDSLIRKDGKTVVPAKVFDIHNYTRCGGIIMENIRFYDFPCNNNKNIALKGLRFVPHFTSDVIDKLTGLSVYLQIVSENLNKRKINVVEIISNNDRTSDYMEMSDVMVDIPDIQVNYSVAHIESVVQQNGGLLTDIDLLLVTSLSNDDNVCKILHRILRCDTFVINNEIFGTEIPSNRSSSLYRSVCVHTIGTMLLELLLWRPTNSCLGTSAITVLTKSDFALLSSRIDALPVQQKTVILTSYPPHAGLKSFTKTLRKEKGNKLSLMMTNHKISSGQPLEQIPLADLAFNILDHGIWGGEYYLPVQKNPSKTYGVALDVDRVGDLDSLYWAESPKPICSGINVTVHYAGVNDMEVKRKMGVIALDRTGYFDFSGLAENGSRVMGIADYESIQSHIKVEPELVWPVPAHWSLEDAATVPLAYCLAFYLLCIRSNLFPGMSLLVHGGCGALGQAIISIALANGCDVFTTVSDIKKKQFLLKLYPELKENQIGNSRDISFGEMVLQLTKGLGCDIVIANGVKGDLKIMSTKCVRISGVIIDTSMLLNRELYDLGMSFLQYTKSFYTADLFSSTEDIRKLQMLVSEGIARGYVRPLTRVTFPPQEVSRAFRLKATGHHRGRVLLDLQQDVSTFIQTKINCSPQLCQIILAENEVLGIKLLDRLISRGAKKIIFIPTDTTNCLSAKLRMWSKQGIQVKVLLRNVFNEIDISNPLNGDDSTSVEGIYYILDKVSDEDRRTLQNVILLSQSVLSTLKYSAIIYAGKDTWEQISVPQSYENLLSWIRLPTVKIVVDETNREEAIFEEYAIDAIERALCLKQRDVIVQSIKKPTQNSFLHEVAGIAGINIPKDVPEEDIFKYLRVEPKKFDTFRTYLRNVYHISIDENLMSSLNCNTLLDIIEKSTEKVYEETEGLKTFLSYVDHDELLATTEMVFLPTLSKSSEMRVDEFDVNEKSLCVIPGVEGLNGRFRTLCERLKLPALVLQPGFDRPHETILDMAQRYAKCLVKKTQLKNTFYILGYESGVIVALEMAAILEDEGLIGTVFCIGGSPTEVQAAIKQNLSKFKTEVDLQDAVIRHMYTLIANETTGELDKVLQKSLTWKEKVDSCVKLLLGRIKYSKQYTEDIIKSAYGKIVEARRYDGEPRQLRSRVVCLRPSTVYHSETSSIQKHSLQKVVEYQLDAPLAFAAQDLQCSAIINRHLDDEILESFNKKNLCETYVLNTETLVKNNF